MTEEERANYQPQYADPLATPQGQIDYIKGSTKRGASEREVISELSRMTGKNPLELKKDEVVIFRLNEEDEDSLDLILDEELSKKILEVYAEDVNEEN